MNQRDSSAGLPAGLAPSDSVPPLCWVVTGGAAGMEKQALALAARLGYTAVPRRVKLRAPWRFASPPLLVGLRWAVSPRGDRLTPPAPPLVIGCGRAAIAPTLALRGEPRGPRPFTIFVGDPRIDPRAFDLVVAPAHDRLAGRNVVVSPGSLHDLTRDRLAAAAARFEGLVAHLPAPRVAVLVGGRSRHHRLGPAEATALGRGLAGMVTEAGAGLMITTSRRTGAEATAALVEALAGTPHLLWDGGGENPYEGFLALADAIVVTADSVNMASEAIATGRPVLVAPLPGRPSKIDRFHAALFAWGRARPFAGRLDLWTPPSDDPLELVAAAVADRLAAAGLPAGREPASPGRD